MRVRFVTAALAALAFSGGRAASAFEPGFIYVVQRMYESCSYPWYRELDTAIWEVNPETGEWRIFASKKDGLCNSYGLTFTPDGTRLRVGNFQSGTVIDFDAAGNGEVVYTTADGIYGTYPAHSITFDARGDAYFASLGGSRILRFRNDRRPGEVYLSYAGGDEVGAASIAFSPGGELYAAKAMPSDRAVRVFDRAGRGRLFDLFPPGRYTYGLAIDRAGNVYVSGSLSAESDHQVFKYPAGNPAARRVLSPVAFRGTALVGLAFSQDQRELYVVDRDGVYGVDAESGDTRDILVGAVEPDFTYLGGGIAVYDPPIWGDLNCDRVVNFDDIEPFVLALTDLEGYATTEGTCHHIRGDINGDGRVDFDDISPFIDCLLAGGCGVGPRANDAARR